MSSLDMAGTPEGEAGEDHVVIGHTPSQDVLITDEMLKPSQTI
jgi:hypothetical protein